MKLVVPVKAAAALDDDDPELLDDGSAVDPDYLEWELNEWDAFSLEAAVQLRDAQGGEVVAVTVGDDEVEETLRECLAKGADRAVRIWDDTLRIDDPLAVSHLLAAALENEAPDLVVCGVQSSDFGSGAVGTALAAKLGLARTAVAKSIQIVDGGGALELERELEGGLVEQLRLPLPALVTLQTGTNEPRYASLKAIKGASAKRLDVLELDDLGIAAEELAAVTGSRVREVRTPDLEHAEMLEGPLDDVAARILAVIEEGK